MQVGEAVVGVDGIGYVETAAAYRGRGYGRRVMEAAIQRMRGGDAAMSIVWGIPDYYEKFGYATAGPEYSIVLDAESQAIGATVPPGWVARSSSAGDVAAMQRLYQAATATSVGPLVRASAGRSAHEAEGPAWSPLLGQEGADACRVLIDPRGEVAAYAWSASGAWWAPYRSRAASRAALFAEVLADGPAAADAILSVCLSWAAADGRTQIEIPAPPEGPVATAAMLRGGSFTARYSRSGAFMCRLLDVRRLLQQMLPEFSRRLRCSGVPFAGSLRLETEDDAACLSVNSDELSLIDHPGAGPTVSARLPQHELARLALGAFPPRALMACLPDPPRGTAADLLTALFPPRHPHPYPADMF